VIGFLPVLPERREPPQRACDTDANPVEPKRALLFSLRAQRTLPEHPSHVSPPPQVQESTQSLTLTPEESMRLSHARLVY
jgi:hypothetical protein